MNRLNGIQRRSFTLAAIVSVIAVTSTAQGLLADQSKHDNFSPAFYAFQNGVRFSTAKQRVAVLKELGYDGIGSADPNDLPTRLKLYDETGLKIYSLYVGANLGPDGARYDPIVAEAIRQLKGRDTVIEFYLRGKTDSAEMQALSVVREVADLAAESGLRMVIYPHAGFYIDTLGDAVRIAEKAERKNVGVMFNLCHFLKVEPESDLKETLQNARPYLWRVSVCGADVGGKDWKQLIQTLDQGTFDQTALLRQLRELNFTGAIGLQSYAVPGDPRENLRRSMEAWRRHLAAARP